MLQFKKQSLRALTAVLGAQFGVDILIQGETAYTNYDGEPPVINIPDINLLDPDADNEMVTTLVRGFLDHEAGHVRFSDRDIIRNLSKYKVLGTKHPLFDDAFLRNVWNIYEDVFIERKMGEYYKGCAINLRNIGNRLFVDKAPKSLVEAAYGPFGHSKEYSMSSAVTYLLMQITLYRARGMANPDIQAKLDTWMQEIQAAHNRRPYQPVPRAMLKFYRELEPIVQQALKVHTSKECLDLAMQTIALMADVVNDTLKDYQQKRKQNQQTIDALNQQNNMDDEGQEHQSEQGQQSDKDGGTDSNGLPTTRDEARAFDDYCATATDTLEKLSKALQARADSATGDKDNPCDIKKLDQGLQSLTEGANKDELANQRSLHQQGLDDTDLVRRMAGDLSDLIMHQKSHALSNTRTHDCTRRSGYRDDKVTGASAISDDSIREMTETFSNTLGRKLRSVLQTNTLVRHGVSARGTRIDTRKLWRMGAHNPRVFRHDTEGHAVDTEIIMLVDCTGSMSGVCHTTAMASALGMLKATQTIPACNIGIIAFSSADVYIVKHPRQNARVQDVTLVPAGGSTYIGGAYRTAMEEFTGQAKKNVVIILSDGASSEASDERVMTEALAEAEEFGIITLGVGLGDRFLAKLLPEDRFFYAINHKTVPTILFDLLKRAMA